MITIYRSSAFKSTVERKLEGNTQFRIVSSSYIPTKLTNHINALLQSNAPGPGRYESFKKTSNTGPSSAFKSKVPRFAGKVSVSFKSCVMIIRLFKYNVVMEIP